MDHHHAILTLAILSSTSFIQVTAETMITLTIDGPHFDRFLPDSGHLSTLSVFGTLDCVMECVNRVDCGSVTYFDNNKSCGLNQNQAKSVSDLQAAAGQVYYSIVSVWIRMSFSHNVHRACCVWNCQWGDVLKRYPGINRKSRVLYPSPGFISSTTTPPPPVGIKTQKLPRNDKFVICFICL